MNVSTDKVFSRIDTKKNLNMLNEVKRNRESWTKCKLYAHSRYKVYKYQFGESKRDVYIIKDTQPSAKYYYFVR